MVPLVTVSSAGALMETVPGVMASPTLALRVLPLAVQLAVVEPRAMVTPLMVSSVPGGGSCVGARRAVPRA